MYRALDVSKYIITKCTNEDKPISNMQLQKILYFIQLDYLKRFDKPVFSDEIEAWQFGPVVPNVYYYFSGFGSMTIPLVFSDYNISPDDKININKIVEVKRELFPWDMVKDTHKEGGPWDLIYKNGKGKRNIIPMDLIKELG